MLKTGSDDWWQSLSGPQSEASGDAYRVTFWWRDPAGSEATSGDAAGVDLYHRRHRPPQKCRPANPTARPGHRCLAMADHALADLARQLLFYPLRTR
ncbi:enterobactin/ferric enterobactin esterase [Raoultella terrigena]|uniref:Enterobactin/ferric enterobactin esterase n=1 Tax=Raoultella terrigena TaxID=577 RepID=A0A4U9D838_RAOTE|nr:enterobactin/ferric enterobactin esterase [Raoultella terrigena]